MEAEVVDAADFYSDNVLEEEDYDYTFITIEEDISNCITHNLCVKNEHAFNQKGKESIYKCSIL